MRGKKKIKMTQPGSSPVKSSNTHLELKFFNDLLQPDEAREILIEVYKRKINFHTVKNLSSHVRYFKENESERNIINKLKEELEFLLEIIAKAKSQKSLLQIQSEIKITTVQS